MVDEELTKQLDERGYVALPGLIPGEFLGELNKQIEALFKREGDTAGSEFKQEPGCQRLANLVDKGKVFQDVISEPTILAYVRQVLGDLKLSSLNVRRVLPMAAPRQPLHADMAARPDARGPWVCNVLWMMHDIEVQDGPLRVIPGTHRSPELPQQALKDPTDSHPDEVLVTGSAGTVVIMNAHLWHGGMENKSTRPRTAMHAFYCRNDKPQQQYQKRLLSQQTVDSLAPDLRRLLALDDPENDRLSAGVRTTSGFMK